MGEAARRHARETFDWPVVVADYARTEQAMPLLREESDYCQQVKDFTSGQLFEKILRNEEEHVDFLEKQFDMIVRMGEQNYIQLQSAAAGEEGNEGGAWGLGGGDGNGN